MKGENIRTMVKREGLLMIIPEAFKEMWLLSQAHNIDLGRLLATYLIADIQRAEDVTIEGYEILENVGRYLASPIKETKRHDYTQDSD